MKWISRIILILILSCMLTACDFEPWNNPYSEEEADKNYYYTSFAQSPRTLDPARAYSSNEYNFIAQIYESPLQYHFLDRPYRLVPLTARQIPTIRFFDTENNELVEPNEDHIIAFTEYEIAINSGILYQPHPAFAQNQRGQYHYHFLSEDQLESIDTLADFEYTGTRELVAEDYLYQIKRLANPKLGSPILGLMSNYIIGLEEYAELLDEAIAEKELSNQDEFYLDLREYPLASVELVDRYTYRIRLKGHYPQFLYWLTMPFFAPVPWEADLFYSQVGMGDRNISFDWYPVGTGAYMLSINDPNREMILEKNPNFHEEYFPEQGEAEDKLKGFLKDANKRLPFIEKFIFNLEKEAIPRWNKFLQGYYDGSQISADSFDQAIVVNAQGDAELTQAMQTKKIGLTTVVDLLVYYIGFNMLDEVIGGGSERARKLRQALSIAVDYEEYIALFLNGRGFAAQNPLPPGIFGHLIGEKGTNPVVYHWQNNQRQRRSIDDAKQLLIEAGYQDGIDPETNAPLVLYYDIAASNDPDAKARFNWLRKQFSKIGIDLQVRATQYNRFQEKMRTGDAQLFMWGWGADYPDPENFLFLLYGPNGKVNYGGENAANYSNSEYDKLFIKMKSLPNGAERMKIIQEMLIILQNDAPWIWGFFPKSFTLNHQWVYPSKPHQVANNVFKYRRLNPLLREKLREQWNEPNFKPILIIIFALMLLMVPIGIFYWRKEHRPPTLRNLD